jgi:hypothetical protein
LTGLYGSKSFAQPGNDNYRGVNSRVADALIDAMNRAAPCRSCATPRVPLTAW